MEEERKQEEKRKMGRVKKTFLALLIVAATLFVGYWIVVGIIWRVTMADDCRLGGHWQMIDESWEVELKFRQKRNRDEPYFNSNLYFKPCRFPWFWSEMTSFDKTAPKENESVDFVDFDIEGTILSGYFGGPWDVSCEWLDDDVIVLEDENGQARVYRRK